jgi:hypothetical protein
MTLVMAELTMPLMAFIALDKFISQPQDKTALKQLKLSFYIVGGILLFFILFASALFSFAGPNDAASGLPDWFMTAIKADRIKLFRTDAIRSLVFVLLAFGLLYAYSVKKIKLSWLLVLIPAFILADMWPVNKRYINNDDFVRKSQAENPYQATKADLEILKDTDPFYRVYNFSESFDGSARTSYFHKNIGGYHGAKMRRYQEIVDHSLIRERQMIAEALNSGTVTPEAILSRTSVFNMLNTKYFIVDPKMDPLKNPYALGNAWFVEKYRIVNSADEEIKALESFDPRSEAIIENRFVNDLGGFTAPVSNDGTIVLGSYSPNKMVYQSSSKSDQLAVFSEVYYQPGWNAYVDGVKSPHVRADYLLRAMIIPAGDHQVEFRFEPKSFYAGQKVSLAASLITILLTLGVLLLAIFPDYQNKWLEKIRKY